MPLGLQKYTPRSTNKTATNSHPFYKPHPRHQKLSLKLQIFDFSLQRCPLAPKNTPRGAQIKQPRIATLFTNLFQAYSWQFAVPNALQLKEKERKGGSEERISSQFGVPNALQLKKEPGRRCYGAALRFDRQRGG